MRQTIKRKTLEAAASAGVLRYGQVDPLLIYLVQQDLGNVPGPSLDPGRLNPTHLLYGLSGVLAVGILVSIALFGVGDLGIGALLCFLLLSVLLAYEAARWCAQHELPALTIVCAAVAAALVPVTLFALQYLLGYWATEVDLGRMAFFWNDGRWLVLEVAGALAASALLWRFARRSR